MSWSRSFQAGVITIALINSVAGFAYSKSESPTPPRGFLRMALNSQKSPDFSTLNNALNESLVWTTLRSPELGNGQFLNINRSGCRLSTVKESTIRVTSFYSEKGVAVSFENIRSSPEYKADRSNIQSLISEGSLVELLDDTASAYRSIRVISQSKPIAGFSANGPNFTSAGATGFIHAKSLGDLRDYALVMTSNPYEKAAQNQQVYLAQRILAPIVFESGEVATLSCDDKDGYHLFRVYSIQEGKSVNLERIIAVHPSDSKLFENILALPIDEIDEDLNINLSAQLMEDVEGVKLIYAGLNISKASEGDEPESQPPDQASEITGSPNLVACVDTRLSVRKLIVGKGGQPDSIGGVDFYVNGGEGLKISEAWNVRDIERGGHTYRRVEFPRLKKFGWVADSYIRNKAECESVSTQNGEDRSESAVSTQTAGDFIFPTFQRPTDSYRTGSRAFGAGRKTKKGGRRAHAACDLYRTNAEVVRVVADGSVIRGPYYFYQGTHAVEVRHADFIARYGEIYGSALARGKVSKGQKIAKIKRVNSGCCKPMLHFETYSNEKSTASLSVPINKKNPYGRRTDLFNPTSMLRTWEKLTFGRSY